MADAPPKKKLPFKQHKRPSAPTPTPGADKPKHQDDLDMFDRSREMRAIIERDRQRASEKKRKVEAQAKEKERKEERERQLQRRSAEKRPLGDDEEFHDAKERQSLGDDGLVATGESSAAAGDDFDHPATPPAQKRARTNSASASSRNRVTPSTSVQRQGSPSARRGSRLRSAMSTPSKNPRSGPSADQVISLDSDDEDVKPVVHSPLRQPDSVDILDDTLAEADIDSDEDPELAEYIRKAEEEKKKLAETVGGSTAMVLLTSELDGATPVEIKMKLDQPLVKAREAWVMKQWHKNSLQLPCLAEELVISWKRQKVYNYSTLYSLGVRTHGDSITTADRKGLSSDRRKVHLEISTPEIWQRSEAEKERQRRKDEAEDLSEDEVVQVEEEEVKLRVILKARDLEEVKLTVRPATTAKTLTLAYRRSRKLDDGKKITLWFDGDQLGDDSTLEQMDIDDMDTIEVHIN